MRRLLPGLTVLLPAFVFAQTHTFDTGNSGWGATGDPTSETAAWLAVGGNPGGYIRVTDASVGGTWYFDAPAAFTGNKCDAYGKFLRYDQFTNDTSNSLQYGGRPDVIIFGAGLILAFDNAVNPGLSWTHYDIPLVETAGWRLNDINGPLVTQAQFRAALANMSGLRIRGEYRAQDDFGGLDNVVLESNFHFDLDGDDSSGAFNGDFLADTLCAPPSKVLDADAVLSSESAIDSIRVSINFAGANEEIEAGLLPPTVSIQIYPQGKIVLVNTGNATVNDFLLALQTLLYQDFSPVPVRGLRLIEFRVFTSCGEAAVVNAYLPLYPPPMAGLDGDTLLCAGSPALPLVAVLDGLPEPGGYWQPATRLAGQFDPSTDPPGTYAYIIPGAGECPGDTALTTVNVQAGFLLRADTTICYDDTLVLAVPPGLFDWTWNDGSRAEMLDVTAPGLYTLSGRSGVCTFSDAVEIGFYTCRECPFYAPNVFSPNDDGTNDLFQVFLSCAYTGFQLEVFDRWGGLVFASDDPEAGWNGLRGRREQAPGLYLWRAEWEGELFGERKVTRKAGEVMLVR